MEGALHEWSRPPGARAPFERHLGVAVRSHFTEAECAAWAAGVYAARAVWTPDFGGEQFSLGRAFYTHLEEGRSARYFDDPASSDARVEQHLPTMQRRMRALVAELAGGEVRQRRGWCGPGVHVFPAHGKVAKRGGVVHFDTEGLSSHHLARRAPALTVVAMLQPPAEGGGLRIWDARYDGDDEVDHDGDDSDDSDDSDDNDNDNDNDRDGDDERLSRASVLATSAVGDVIVIDSYRLHQIQPFLGARDRVSVTVHAAESSRGVWETWF